MEISHVMGNSTSVSQASIVYWLPKFLADHCQEEEEEPEYQGFFERTKPNCTSGNLSKKILMFINIG